MVQITCITLQQKHIGTTIVVNHDSKSQNSSICTLGYMDVHVPWCLTVHGICSVCKAFEVWLHHDTTTDV
jgi:hypothetical protein